MATSLFFSSNGFQNKRTQGQSWQWGTVLFLKRILKVAPSPHSQAGTFRKKSHSLGVIKPAENISTEQPSRPWNEEFHQDDNNTFFVFWRRSPRVENSPWRGSFGPCWGQSVSGSALLCPGSWVGIWVSIFFMSFPGLPWCSVLPLLLQPLGDNGFQLLPASMPYHLWITTCSSLSPTCCQSSSTGVH